MTGCYGGNLICYDNHDNKGFSELEGLYYFAVNTES